MTKQDPKATIESAANKFAETLKKNMKVREVIYLIAFDEPGTEETRMAHGTTEEAPDQVRKIMLREALKARN